VSQHIYTVSGLPEESFEPVTLALQGVARTLVLSYFLRPFLPPFRYSELGLLDECLPCITDCKSSILIWGGLTVCWPSSQRCHSKKINNPRRAKILGENPRSGNAASSVFSTHGCFALTTESRHQRYCRYINIRNSVCIIRDGIERMYSYIYFITMGYSCIFMDACMHVCNALYLFMHIHTVCMCLTTMSCVCMCPFCSMRYVEISIIIWWTRSLKRERRRNERWEQQDLFHRRKFVQSVAQHTPCAG